MTEPCPVLILLNFSIHRNKSKGEKEDGQGLFAKGMQALSVSRCLHPIQQTLVYSSLASGSTWSSVLLAV